MRAEPNAPVPDAAGFDAAELAGGLAHELRNPLSTMMVTLKLLAEDLQPTGGELDESRRRALKKVDVLRHEAERLQALCDDFLNLLDPRRLERRPKDLNETVRRLGEFFELLAGQHRIKLALCVCEGPLICGVDENLIRQAILNLMINAQQAMPDGGRLEVATAQEKGHAVVRVRDTGTGVAPEHREKMMQPFFSTKSGGTGLGLAITRRIIEEHGGVLTFESEVGKGTAFTIRIPCSAARTE